MKPRILDQLTFDDEYSEDPNYYVELYVDSVPPRWYVIKCRATTLQEFKKKQKYGTGWDFIKSATKVVYPNKDKGWVSTTRPILKEIALEDIGDDGTSDKKAKQLLLF